MFKCLIIWLLASTRTVIKGITRYDNNTCYDKTAREFYCCSNYEEINSECIECKLGFMSRKGNSCEPCAFNLFGEDCSGECRCNELQRCDKAKGCVEQGTSSTQSTQSNIATDISAEESETRVHEEEQNDSRIEVTTKLSLAKYTSSEEIETKVHTEHVEEQYDGLSKTELLTLFCGALSGIMVLLGCLGISNFVKKRMRLSKSKRDKTSEEEVHTAEEQRMHEALELHESHYEIIDDSNFDIILVPQTCNSNLEKMDESQNSESSANGIEDRSSYLEPLGSHMTMVPGFQKEEQSHRTLPSARKTTFIENKTCSPNFEMDNKSSIFESPTNCNDDQSIYLQPLSSLITNDSSYHTEEQSCKAFPQ
ncbi:unnamed protein product [Mytilus edulis]|uniref:Uncharacterized protein n=1 Tax=Mytilus edulis TaxID=6550 RepID=A0A8S3VF71_MYTED|nr:unnamed protein product [Mytilus edulis]